MIDPMATPLVKKSVQRFDRFSIGSRVSFTPQGFAKIPASITRTGVLEYKLPNGQKWKELRLPEEVQRADSLATLSGAPVTEQHHGMITPDNVGDHQVGYVAGDARFDEKMVDADLLIQQRKTIDGVKRGDLKEVSAGYSCDLELNDGEWEGERYDAIQRNIVYNHVAIGPENWARGGSELSLHLDSKDEHAIGIAAHLDSKNAGEPPVKPKQRGITMKKIVIRLDGVPYEIEIPESLATTFEAAIEKLQKSQTENTERLDSLQGELDASKTKVTDLEKQLKEAGDPAKIEQAVKVRVQLVQDCKKLHPEIETEGKSSKDLMIEALEHSGMKKENFDGKAEGYIEGFFKSRASDVEDTEDKPAGAGVSPAPRQDSQDEIDEYDSDAARERMIKKNAELCKVPE
jgi:hypothetical protein